MVKGEGVVKMKGGLVVECGNGGGGSQLVAKGKGGEWIRNW